MARLGDICRFQSGGTPAKSEPLYFNGTIPWITTVALNGKHINEKNAVDWITEKAINNSAAKIVPPHSIMIGTRVGVGKVAINDVPMSTSQDIVSLIGIDEEKWNKDYICKFILSQNSYLDSQSRGATIKGIKIETIADLSIPDIPMDQQAKIFAVIEKTDQLISLRKVQLEKLDDLVKARFVEMFGEPHRSKTYPYTKVSELTDVVSGGTPDRKNEEYWNDGTIPWVKTTELQNNVITEVEERITGKGLSASSAKIVPANTVLIAMYGQGKTRGMTGFLGIEACTNQACACLLPTSNIDMQYLWHFLILSYDELRGLAQGGNQPNLNAGMIKDFPILVPPMEKQKQFVSFVSQVEKSKLSIQQGLGKLETLKKSLMQQFYG